MKFSIILFVLTIAFATGGFSQLTLAKGNTDHHAETPSEGKRQLIKRKTSLNNAQNQRALRRVPAHIYDPIRGQWVLPHQASD